MAKFCTLASSSRGNSSWLCCRETSILIDAGISCRRMLTAVSQLSGEAAKIDAVLITHEHTDHIGGLHNLIKKTGAKVFAPEAVLDYIIKNGCVPAGSSLTPIDDKTFAVGEIEVTAFSTPHDSIASTGYRMTLPDGEKVAVATDLGYVTEKVRAGVMGCGTVLLESNYDNRLLDMGSYPWFLKQRIRSENGHLENSVSAQFAAELIENGTSRLILGHLSRENNNPSLARQTALELIAQSGATEGVDYQLEVADYDNPSRVIRF